MFHLVDDSMIAKQYPVVSQIQATNNLLAIHQQALYKKFWNMLYHLPETTGNLDNFISLSLTFLKDVLYGIF